MLQALHHDHDHIHIQLSTTTALLSPLRSKFPNRTMAPLTTAARALARTTAAAAAAPRAAARCLSTTAVRADAAGSSSYESPFKGERPTTRVPDFSHYASKGAPSRNLTYSYFVVGGMGAITAMGAKSTIQGERASQRASGRKELLPKPLLVGAVAMEGWGDRVSRGWLAAGQLARDRPALDVWEVVVFLGKVSCVRWTMQMGARADESL